MEIVASIAQCFALKPDWSAWGAIATFLAAGIALGIGVWPVLLRKRHAKAIALIAYMKIEQQLLYAGQSEYVATQPNQTVSQFNAVKINLEKLDASGCREMLPYFDVLPPRAAKSLASCIADTDTVRTIAKSARYRTHAGGNRGPSFDGIVKDLVKTISLARAETARYLGKEPVDITAPVAALGKSLDGFAGIAEVNGYDEGWMRDRVLGPAP